MELLKYNAKQSSLETYIVTINTFNVATLKMELESLERHLSTFPALGQRMELREKVNLVRLRLNFMENNEKTRSKVGNIIQGFFGNDK